MKLVSNGYKQNIKTFGKEIAVKITYTINGTTTILENEDINSANFNYQGNLLKSVMKCLELDTNTNIPLNTILTYQFGVKVGNSYEYITLGDFIVKEVEKQEDTNSYYLTCYDKMLYAMTNYEDLGITYPLSVRDYLSAICTKLGITFGSSSDNFVNYNQNITEEPYLDPNGNSLNYTFRDVLDELAQITVSTICINDNNELEVRYINTTNETLDEDSLKSINVNFGEKYEVDVEIDNQILNYMDRQSVLTNAYNEINGVEYYLNDFDSFGITYLELCDRYNIQVGNTTYSCIMLNDEINVRDGLGETIYTEEPKQNNSPYTYVNDTDKAVRQATITLDQKIGEVDIKGKTINLTADDIKIDSTYFKVDKNGNIVANSLTSNNATITGGSVKIATENYNGNTIINAAGLKVSDDYGTLTLAGTGLLGPALRVGGFMWIGDYLIAKNGGSPTYIDHDLIIGKGGGIGCKRITAGNMDCGSGTCGSNGYTQINFNKTFANVPKVVCTCSAYVNGVIALKTTDITTTGFKVTVGGSGFSNISFDWIAMDM